MILYNNIQWVHLEISTRCNANCPDCPRNLRGVVVPEIASAYPLVDMKLSQAQTIFTESFLKQINGILINGNHGDFVTAQDGVEIIEYFLTANPKLHIQINTNASARPKIWERLGELGIQVDFRIDGLKDTHHLYRQNTDFDFILDNARKFISAGGRAVWMLDGFVPKKVSDEYIERILDAEGDALVDATGFGLRTNGHFFYVINLFS